MEFEISTLQDILRTNLKNPAIYEIILPLRYTMIFWGGMKILLGLCLQLLLLVFTPCFFFFFLTKD